MSDGGVLAKRFAVLLALVVVAGAALRVAYVLTVTQGDRGYYDALFYSDEARMLATGRGWIQPLLAERHPSVIRQTAEHPPGTVVALLPAAFIGDLDARDLAMRATMVLIGCGTIVLVGLIGRAIAGPLVGLLAASFAVIDPNLWMNDGIMMSEALATLVTAGLIYLGYKAWRGQTSWPMAVALGALCGVATLTRSELMFLFPLLVIPVLVAGARRRATDLVAASSTTDGAVPTAAPTRSAWTWLRPVVIAVVAFGVVLAPWSIYNLSRFEKTTVLSTTLGLSILAANCDHVYYGTDIGLTGILDPRCVPVNHGVELSVHDARLRRLGVSYVEHHLDRLPLVTAVRIGRAFYLFRVGQTIDATHPEGRPVWAEWLGAVATWILLALSVAGFVILGRRRIPRWPLVAPFVAAVATFVLVAGYPRYRASGEPTLLVLSAVTAAALVTWIGGRRNGRTSASTGPKPEEVPAALS